MVRVCVLVASRGWGVMPGVLSGDGLVRGDAVRHLRRMGGGGKQPEQQGEEQDEPHE